MYVTTFYSFKGGVGRTMALVNVAVDLARRGRRVLAVDFDLEAPGLDTFDLPRPSGTTPGMIDFVSAYLGTGQAPHFEDYVFESSGVGNDGGGLWIMPSGAHHESYARTFAHIDWGVLYEQHDGYLLFEDLKEQWQAFLQPDYVLVDSRTGYTDVGGICTRQLPHAVVLLFFPNAQNLRGLSKVVRDIRAERTEPRDKAIDLHFVMSNVPDLDDEDKILEESITSFQHNLGFESEPMVIHRYDSLSLLNQVIFTKDRPRSRLAKEYQAVTAEITRLNPKDRDGALDYIAQMGWGQRTPTRRGPSLADEDNHLNKIEEHHRADGEVLFRLGLLRGDDEKFEDSAALFDRAIEAGYREPEVYLRRAVIRRREHDDRDGACQDAVAALQSVHASPGQVRRALALITPDHLDGVADSPAVVALPPSEQVWIASELNRSRIQAETAAIMLGPLLVNVRLSTEEREHARHAWVLTSITLGRFSDAIEVVRSEYPDVGRMSIQFAFNYGMALWGECGQLVREPFDRVVEIDRSNPSEDPTPNYLQCIAIAYWGVGELDAAREAAEKARREMRRSIRRSEFSCWQYLHVPGIKFEKDVEEILKLIGGDDGVMPRFMNQRNSVDSS